MDAPVLPARPFAYARARRPRFVEELKAFVRFPSVSAQPAHAADVSRCADWLAGHLRAVGMDRVTVVATPRHPLVYAQWRRAPGRPTVLIYGHYDVQPADPLAEWQSPPFEPVVRGTNLYGRGASDDKGQMFAHVKALEAYLRTERSLPVNVICLFEGEEEIGSPNLMPFLARNREALAADVAVVSDMPILAPGRPALTYGMRGGLALELEVRGPERDLHSGLYGGAIPNPIQALREIVARLHDIDGRVAIPGFYARVREASAEERALLARVGPTDAQILRDSLAGALIRREGGASPAPTSAPLIQGDAHAAEGRGERGYTAYEHVALRPALTLNGIQGGYQGAGGKGIIPARASVKLSFRLVPDQDPHEIARLCRRQLARIAPPGLRYTLRTSAPAAPALLDLRSPFTRAAADAYRTGFGASPVLLRSGGTIPIVNILQRDLGIPVVLMGFALPDDRMHAPNERFHLPNFYNGVATSITFLANAGRTPTQRDVPVSEFIAQQSGNQTDARGMRALH